LCIFGVFTEHALRSRVHTGKIKLKSV
jgi:hypothetical protein